MRAVVLALVGCVSVACGKTESSAVAAVTMDGGGHDDGAVAEREDAGRDSSVGRDAVSTADAEVCVDIEVGTDDQTCGEDSDCTFAGATEKVCMTYCCGGGVPVNRAAAARIKAQERSITASLCPGGCPVGPHPRCVNGACIACPPGFDPSPPACVDASAPDGATCINIDATYPGTCETPSDCAAVLLGTVCSTTCNCEANAAIPAIWLGAYQSDLGGITLEACHCPPARATCTAGQCVLCPSPGTPNPSPGCD